MLAAKRRCVNILSLQNSEHQVWVGATRRCFGSEIIAANRHSPPELTVILRT